MVKFLRRTSKKISKLGRKRKKKQVWRNPTGRHNKIREKRKGQPASVSIGYRTEKKDRELIDGKEIVKINNLNDLKNIGKKQIGLLGKVGKKKKMEIAKEAEKNKIEIKNLNIKKFLIKTEKENKK
jgi:ribosomal protein L32E